MRRAAKGNGIYGADLKLPGMLNQERIEVSSNSTRSWVANEEGVSISPLADDILIPLPQSGHRRRL